MQWQYNSENNRVLQILNPIEVANVRIFLLVQGLWVVLVYPIFFPFRVKIGKSVSRDFSVDSSLTNPHSLIRPVKNYREVPGPGDRHSCFLVLSPLEHFDGSMMWAESPAVYHRMRRNGSGERLRRIGPTWKYPRPTWKTRQSRLGFDPELARKI